MNRLLRIFPLAAVAVVMLVSCGPGEISSEEWGYVSSIYTVDKHTLRPEFEDTLYRINNFDEFSSELATGDRAHILLYYYQDYYSAKGRLWKINRIVEKIPTMALTAREDIDADTCDMPFTGLPYYELYGRHARPEWIWKNKLNVNVSFKSVVDSTMFAMKLRGVSNDTLHMNLLAKSYRPSDKKYSKLLTFDLNGIDTLLTKEEKSALKNYEKLKFRVHLKYENEKEQVVDMSFPVMAGDIDNPVYKNDKGVFVEWIRERQT